MYKEIYVLILNMSCLHLGKHLSHKNFIIMWKIFVLLKTDFFHTIYWLQFLSSNSYKIAPTPPIWIHILSVSQTNRHLKNKNKIKQKQITQNRAKRTEEKSQRKSTRNIYRCRDPSQTYSWFYSDTTAQESPLRSLSFSFWIRKSKTFGKNSSSPPPPPMSSQPVYLSSILNILIGPVHPAQHLCPVFYHSIFLKILALNGHVLMPWIK